MTTTAARRARPFYGRGAELTALLALVDGGPTRVTSLHGIAGIGKSELLAEFAKRAGATGATVLGLDCRAVEPTERGFLAAAGDFQSVQALADHLRGGPAVVTLDHYEVFRLMDTWLRQVLVPALPDGVSLVISGRERPVAGWFALQWFRTLPVAPLEQEDAIAMLVHAGVAWTEAPRLYRIARGHPLALMLASAGAAEHPELALEDAALTRVVDELSRLYLEDVEDELARRALEAASVVRRATEPLLSAMLDEDDGAEALRRLLELPIVDTSRDGFVVHEAVRDAIAAFLRGTNPIRYDAYRRAAWRQLRAEAREAAATERWRYTADMLYLSDTARREPPRRPPTA